MKKKKLTTILLVIFTMISTSIVGMGAASITPTTFLALGDSISTGYGLADYSVIHTSCYAPGSFVELLKSEKGFATTNFAYDGMTTALLAEKTNPQNMSSQLKQIVQSSNIISITIGGNDLLSALYTAMASAMGGTINLGTPEGVAAIQAAIIAGGTGSNPQLAVCLAKAIKAVSTNLPSLSANYGNALTQVITNLKILNPTSTVVIQTIANPYKFVPGADALVGALDVAVTTLNSVIIGGAQTGAYKLVDVYTAFKNSSEVLTNATDPLMPLDPHPNAAGHKMIANLVFKEVHIHTEGDWIIDKDPSYTEEGIRHTICTVCKETIRSEAIEKRLAKENIVDTITGIKVEYTDGTGIDENITFVLTSKSNTEMISYKEGIDHVAKGFTPEKIYDMKLMKGDLVVQSSGNLKVTIPMSAAMKNMSEIKIVNIDETGVITISSSEIIEDNIVFTTDNLGCFGVIGKSTASIPSTNSPQLDIPNTGDTSSLLPIILLTIISGGALLTIRKKKLYCK